MWFNLEEVTQSLTSATKRSVLSPEDIERQNRKVKREREIYESGIANCMFCKEEIHQNKEIKAGGWSWESEDMLGWCADNPNHVHIPKIEID